MKDIFLLLVLFQIKHFLCDYPLQGKFMLGKFSKDWSVWIPALAAHAFTHYLGTFLVILTFGLYYGAVNPWWAVLCAADAVIHFTVDRIKASPSMLGRWKIDNRYFWWALGADQAAHHLTHYAIIAALVWGSP